MIRKIFMMVVVMSLVVPVMGQLDGFEWLPENYRVVKSTDAHGWALLAFEESIGVGGGYYVPEVYYYCQRDTHQLIPMGHKTQLQIQLHLKRIETLLRTLVEFFIPSTAGENLDRT